MRTVLTMKLKGVFSVTLLAGVLSSSGADAESAKFESTYYKDYPIFSTYPKETERNQPIEHFGPVGIGIDLLLPPFQMKLSRIDKGSPAEASGKLKVGQMIESINGQTLKDIDPRIQLASIITKAEAADGIIKFMVKETPAAKAEEVTVKIPVLGAYSRTWPLNCPKSDKIVRGEADFLARTGNYAGAGIGGLGLLFLLSTGEEKDLEVARVWVKEVVENNKNSDKIDTYPWYAGYGGIGLCEYYLRTGDATILPVIEKLADCLKRCMYNGGWNQKNGVNFGYGHLNAAGVPAATFLLLARECGAKVDEYTLQESLKHFYRFAGHGNVAYGDHLPESGFVDNGKTGKLAFQMAAAAALTPEGENSVYAKARDICAVKSFYSTSWMLHGHTGGGIGEIWRSAAMGLMADKKPAKYREFMDNRQWFYELSRRFDGSMGIVSATHFNGSGYDNPGSWGIGIALSYTIPRKTLRITGAPVTKFSKTYQLPKRPWGTEADEVFYSLISTPDKDGKVYDWGKERLATDASAPIGRRLSATNVADAVLLRYTRHPDIGVRQMAAQVIGRKEGDQLILELLRDKDPRVRQAGCTAIGTRTAPKGKGEPPQAERLTDEMVQLLMGMVNDPNESWWVVEGALNVLGLAKPELLVPHLDRLCYWLQHEDWWLRRGALAAVTGLVADERCYQKLLPIIGKLAANNRSSMVMWSLGGVAGKLRDASPAVQALALQTLAQAYEGIPKKMVAPGGVDMANAENMLVENLAIILADHPGGLDKLVVLAGERFPDQPLPHKELFINADVSKLGPALKTKVNAVMREQFIPEYVANNLVPLLAEARPEPFVAKPLQQAKVEGLVELYKKMGVNEYDWRSFGPVWNEMKWDYFSFDPPETMPWDPGQTRYRKVTYPAGMENWFAMDFDAKKVGWKTGVQPFGQENGKLRTEPKPFIDQLVDRAPSQRSPCTETYCRCCEPMKTIWEKEVLLMRSTVTIPPLKAGYRYRLVVGGLSHMNNGDGVRVYVNGKQVLEREREFKKREGGHPIAYYIDQERLAEFQSGKVTIAATGFLHIHLRSKNKGNFMAIWFEEMKMPPLDQEVVMKAATVKPLLSAEWQALQDPGRNSEDLEAGKFKWDGKFVANPAVLGEWKTIAVVPTVEAFDPAKPIAGRPPFKELAIKDGGLTGVGTMLWSGDTLMDFGGFQSLKMTVKDEYLFVEAGGFNAKNPVGWKSPLVVLTKAGEKK
jgi:hypothetical protein